MPFDKPRHGKRAAQVHHFRFFTREFFDRLIRAGCNDAFALNSDSAYLQVCRIGGEEVAVDQDQVGVGRFSGGRGAGNQDQAGDKRGNTQHSGRRF
ncbi:MAG: hypothetical protein IPK76_05960 [Lewinellaceae bacterium]|nr:hypothetical protein [Lewinellaceae bacterium]